MAGLLAAVHRLHKNIGTDLRLCNTEGTEMKKHPTEVIRYERTVAGTWLVVKRQTTRRGIQGGAAVVLAEHEAKEPARAVVKAKRKAMGVGL